MILNLDILFLYIKILVSEQGKSIYEKLLKYHNLQIIGNDKKGYCNSQHFELIFKMLNYFFTIIL